MANVKISELTAATTPLAGTEVLPVVQSSATVKVSVANLTAGRTVTAASLTTTGDVGVGTSSFSSGGKLVVKTSNAGYAVIEPTSSVENQIATGLRLHGNLNETDRYVGIFCYNGVANNVNNMTFWTSSGGSSAERMRLDSGGSLLVGTTGLPNGTSVYGTALSPQSNGRTIIYQATNQTTTQALQAFYNPNGGVGSISTSGSSTSFATSSDYRLKENIAPMTGALAKVAALKPVTYKWKVDGSDGEGFIAHELQAVVPDAVIGEKDAVDKNGKPVYQGIDTSFLVATLTAAIQELKAEFDAYKASHP